MNESSAQVASENLTGSRIVAGFIDVVVLALLFVVFAILFGESDSDDGSFNLSVTGLPALLLFILGMAYYFVLEMNGGQTLGKKIMGLRVAAVDGILTPQKVLIRTLLRIVDALPFLYLLGIIVVAVSGRKQRIGDMAAGTVIVRA